MPFEYCEECGKKVFVCKACKAEEPVAPEKPKKKYAKKAKVSGKKLTKRQQLLQVTRDYVTKHPGVKFYQAMHIISERAPKKGLGWKYAKGKGPQDDPEEMGAPDE